MAIFDGMHLTEKGALLINKLQSGANLTITRASAGDGYYDEGESAWDLEELKHPRADCTCRIAAREMLADGTTVLTIYISADSSIVPLREIGIHASDPDEGEILYASTNAGDYPDYLPPGTTATTVVRKYKVCIETGEAAEVTIENLSVAEVTREEFENHTHPQLHSHDNKGVLDGITAERVHDWDTAAGGGAVVADGSITMAKLASEVAVEVNKAHEHSNKSVLDTVTADVVSKKHEHDNKSVLDDIDSSKVTGWDTAVSHASSTSNPHGVTKSQVGLGNVPNVATNNQTPTYTTPSTPAELTSGEKLSTAFGKIKIAISRLISHLANTGNPHGVTAAQVGLGNVTNESKATMFTNPTFTGSPKAPTPNNSENSTTVATTAFVQKVVENALASTYNYTYAALYLNRNDYSTISGISDPAAKLTYAQFIAGGGSLDTDVYSDITKMASTSDLPKQSLAVVFVRSMAYKMGDESEVNNVQYLLYSDGVMYCRERTIWSIHGGEQDGPFGAWETTTSYSVFE